MAKMMGNAAWLKVGRRARYAGRREARRAYTAD